METVIDTITSKYRHIIVLHNRKAGNTWTIVPTVDEYRETKPIARVSYNDEKRQSTCYTFKAVTREQLVEILDFMKEYFY